MRTRRSAIALRKDQIAKQLDEIRDQLATKTRKHYKTDRTFEQSRSKRLETISRLESELSILQDPGEYDELPIAVVADELGLTIDQVQSLVWGGEIEPTDLSYNSKKDRIARQEMERAIDVGVKELLRLTDQESAEIFENGLSTLHQSDVVGAERVFRRLEARDSWRGLHAPAFEIALLLAQGALEDAQISIKYVLERDLAQKTTILTYLARVLRGMHFKEHGAQVLRDEMLAVAEGADDDPYRDIGMHSSKQIGKRLDEIQQRAMYITTVVESSLNKYRFKQQFMRYNLRVSEMREEEFSMIVRDAIYTALYAEANYKDSAASKMFVDTTNVTIPRWWIPARLLEKLPHKAVPVSDGPPVDP